MVRAAGDADRAAVWQVLEPVIRPGETLAVPIDIDRERALAYWFAPEHEVFVAQDDHRIIGTYFLQANQPGGGSHVANCGYVTDVDARGRGVANAMCEHSLQRARERGFTAMQFNFVISTNERAIRLWQRHGFEIVGRLPGAFRSPTAGLVDALVMFLQLE